MSAGKIEQRTVTVFKDDAEHALARWRSKGWALDRSTYGEPVAGRPVVVLHIHRRVKAR